MSGYRPQSPDTSEKVDRLVFDAFRRMSPDGNDDLTREGLPRRRFVHLSGEGVPVISPEDLILHRLV